MICPIDGATARKGITVLIPGGSGLVRKRVCPNCARHALPILPVNQTACKCGKAATLCKSCTRSKVKAATVVPSSVKDHQKKLRATATAYDRKEMEVPGGKSPNDVPEDYVQGLAEGLRMAARMIGGEP